MPFEEFDCIVLGDDLPGLWLLRRLQEVSVGKARVCVIGRGQKTNWSVPVAIAETYGMSSQRVLSSLEVVFPDHAYVWDPATLLAKYPELVALDAKSVLLGKKKFPLDALARILRKYPELAFTSPAMWRCFAKSVNPSIELAVLASALLTEIALVSSDSILPPGTQSFVLSSGNGATISHIRPLPQGKVSVQLQTGEVLATRNLVLNDSYSRLAEWVGKKTESWNLLDLGDELSSRRAFFKLSVTVEKGVVPWSLRPLLFLFESDDIPDLDSEVWPVEINPGLDSDELVVWVDAPTQNSQEGLQDRFKLAMRHLGKVFPFLTTGTRSICPPLGMETCYSAEARHRWMENLEQSRDERYERSLLGGRTRKPFLRILSPFVRTDQLYPLGGLRAASEIAGIVWSKKQMQRQGAIRNDLPGR